MTGDNCTLIYWTKEKIPVNHGICIIIYAFLRDIYAHCSVVITTISSSFSLLLCFFLCVLLPVVFPRDCDSYIRIDRQEYMFHEAKLKTKKKPVRNGEHECDNMFWSKQKHVIYILIYIYSILLAINKRFRQNSITMVSTNVWSST